jgi:hypothetical protein
MSHRYYIESGNQRWQQVGEDLTDAVVKAFKRKAPKKPGLLTRCRRTGEPWQYIDTTSMLKESGYKVKP